MSSGQVSSLSCPCNSLSSLFNIRFIASIVGLLAILIKAMPKSDMAQYYSAQKRNCVAKRYFKTYGRFSSISPQQCSKMVINMLNHTGYIAIHEGRYLKRVLV